MAFLINHHPIQDKDESLRPLALYGCNYLSIPLTQFFLAYLSVEQALLGTFSKIKMWKAYSMLFSLTHRRQVTIYVSVNVANIGSDKGLLFIQHEYIIWAKIGPMFIGPLGTYFSEIWINVKQFSFMIMNLNMLSVNVGHFVSSSVRWTWPPCDIVMCQ